MAELYDHRSDLACWFELSYSSFAVLPRVLMEAMPQEWQEKMSRLLFDYNDTWLHWPEGWGSRVQLTVDGKLAKFPDWVLDYRHPNREWIDKLRASSSETLSRKGEST